MASCAYYRLFHLVLLLSIISLIVIHKIAHIFKYGFGKWLLDQLNVLFEAMCLLLLILWFLRGLRMFRCTFPWFHYGTLVAEWLAHLVTVVLWTVALATAIYRGYVFGANANANDLTLTLLRLAQHVVYVLLLIAYVLLFCQ